MQNQLSAEGSATKRYENNPRAFILQTQDESFDQGYAAMLAYRAEPWLYVTAITPVLEYITPELLTLVTDEIFRLGTGVVNSTFEKALHR